MGMQNNEFFGVVRYLPPESLSLDQQRNFPSTFFHEMTHAEQCYNLWRAAHDPHADTIPDWKRKYYDAQLPGEEGIPNEEVFLGKELEAHGKQVEFEKREMGEVTRSTLAGFFHYFMMIHKTTEYKTIPEIKNEVERIATDVQTVSGYTIDSFFKEVGKNPH
jgi:hypothetical protein